MSNSLVQQLREIIDSKHKAAVVALDTIGQYLDEVPLTNKSNLGLQEKAKVVRKQKRSGRKVSIRDQIIAILEEQESATIAAMSEITGLEKRQIRGVVNAPDLKDSMILQSEHDGKAVYSLRNKNQN